MVMATEGASCSALVSGTAKDTLLVAVAAGVLTLVLVLSVSFNGAEVLVVGAVLNARLMSEFCKTGMAMPSLLPEVVLKLPLTAMSVMVAAVGASCGRFFESAKAVLSALGVVASTTTQSKGGTTNMSLLPRILSLSVLVKYTLSLPFVSWAVMEL